MQNKTNKTHLLLLFPLLVTLFLGGCDNQSTTGASKSVTEMGELIKESISFDYYPDTAIEPETLEAKFNLTSDMYDEYFGEMPLISVQSDTLLIIKPAEGKSDAVKGALQSYLDFQRSEAMLYPVNAVQAKAADVYEADGYIYYIGIFGDVTAAEEEGESQLLSLCQERTEEVMSIIDKAE